MFLINKLYYMNTDEKYFHKATKEYDSNELDESIMSKALALSSGDEEKAKWKYIELRAERISEGNDINVKEDDEGKESSPIKSFFSIFSDDEDKKKKEEEEEKKKKEEEEKKGTSGWKIFFIILFFPITIPYYLIKNGFFIFWWSND